MQFLYLNSVTASHSSIIEIQYTINIKHPSDNNGRIIYTGTEHLGNNKQPKNLDDCITQRVLTRTSDRELWTILHMHACANIDQQTLRHVENTSWDEACSLPLVATICSESTPSSLFEVICTTQSPGIGWSLRLSHDGKTETVAHGHVTMCHMLQNILPWHKATTALTHFNVQRL